ncbi:MAG: AEC family transporter [Pseudomonadota bacterium]
MSAVITVALPVFAIIAVGFGAGRLSILTASDAQALNKFVFRIAMPVALFGLTSRTAPPGIADLSLAGAYGLAAAAAFIGAYFFSRSVFSLSGQEAGAHAFAATLGNAVFLGLPIALSVEGWARPFVILMLIEGTLVIILGALTITKRKSGGFAKALVGPARNPLLAGTIFGFLVSIVGIEINGPVSTFIDFVGRTAGPVALFSLGLFLATHRFPAASGVAGRVSAIAAVKMALLPLTALGLARLFGVDDPAALGALALFVFVPAGVTSFVMAEQNGIYQTETAANLLATTVISLATISAVLWLLA